VQYQVFEVLEGDHIRTKVARAVNNVLKHLRNYIKAQFIHFYLQVLYGFEVPANVLVVINFFAVEKALDDFEELVEPSLPLDNIEHDSLADLLVFEIC
jgi:hypothetical protein